MIIVDRVRNLTNQHILIFVTRKEHFNAAHRLHNPEESDEWNRATYGKCNYPNYHGHNYVLKVTVAGEPDPRTGYIIDLGKLKTIIQDEIVDVCDHRNLNLDVDFLKGIIPTTENLVAAFYKQIRKKVEDACYGDAVLYNLKLYETERNVAEYSPYKILKN